MPQSELVPGRRRLRRAPRRARPGRREFRSESSWPQTAKLKMEESPCSSFIYLLSRLESLGQQCDIVIKKFEVVGNILFAAYRWQILHHHLSGLGVDAVRRFKIEVGFYH